MIVSSLHLNRPFDIYVRRTIVNKTESEDHDLDSGGFRRTPDMIQANGSVRFDVEKPCRSTSNRVNERNEQ